MKISRLLAISSIVALLIGVLIGYFIPHASASTSVPADYAAHDIVAAIQNNGGDTSSLNDGETLQAYLGNVQMPVEASSSASFGNNPRVWLGVYTSAYLALDVYSYFIGHQDIGGPVSVTSTYVHGRCLLLNAPSNSVYVQTIIQVCS